MALSVQGYTESQVSPQGSVLFTAEGKPPYRIASFEPNPATRAWMQRSNVKDGRCSPTGKESAHAEFPEFGIAQGDGYHDDNSAVSKSMLAVFAVSPVEYYHQFITGLMPRKAPTPQMKLGTICHAMLLEKKRLDEVCVAYPHSCYSSGEKPRLISERAAAFDASVYPLIAVREQTIPVAAAIIANAKKSPLGELFRQHSGRAKYEVRVDAEICGVRCKCKPDMHIILSDQIIVPDLKFGAFKPDDWRRSATKFSYELQQAHYTAILQKEYGKPVKWSFWAFETKFPFRVGPKFYGPRSVEIAAEYHRKLLRELKVCQDTNQWIDNFESEIEISPWDLTRRGERVSREEETDHTEQEDNDYENTTDVEF